MPIKELQSIEAAEKEIVELSKSLKSHKELVDDFDQIAKSLVRSLASSKKQSERATEHLFESTASIEAHKIATTSAINQIKDTIVVIGKNQDRAFEKIISLSVSQNKTRSQINDKFENLESLLSQFDNELKAFRLASENKSLWDVFGKKGNR